MHRAITAATLTFGCVLTGPAASPQERMPVEVTNILATLQGPVSAASELIHASYDEYAVRRVGDTALHFATVGGPDGEDPLDPDFYAQIYQYTADVASRSETLTMSINQQDINNTPTQANVRVLPQNMRNVYILHVSKNRSIGAVTSDTAQPPIPVPAFTITNSNVDFAVSIIKTGIEYPPGQPHDSTVAIPTEACVAGGGRFELTNPAAFPQNRSEDISQPIHEQYCNAIGQVAVSVRWGVDYNRYRTLFMTLPGIINTSGNVLAMDQIFYESFQRHQPISPAGHFIPAG